MPQAETLSFDGKRDRWKNFDVNMHRFENKKWAKVDEMRRKKREEEIIKKLQSAGGREAQKLKKKLNKLKNKTTGKLSVEVADSDSDSDSGTVLIKSIVFLFFEHIYCSLPSS